MTDTSAVDSTIEQRAASAATWADERYHMAGGMRRQTRIRE